MWFQSNHKDEIERGWVNVTNTGGTTITVYHAAFKYGTYGNASSVGTNEACALPGTAGYATGGGAVPTQVGNFIGLADEDIEHGDFGAVQVYGYMASCLISKHAGNVTVRPGHPMGPIANNSSLGVTSLGGGVAGFFGPVIALDTVGLADHNANYPRYTDHVLIRAL